MTFQKGNKGYWLGKKRTPYKWNLESRRKFSKTCKILGIKPKSAMGLEIIEEKRKRGLAISKANKGKKIKEADMIEGWEFRALLWGNYIMSITFYYGA